MSPPENSLQQDYFYGPNGSLYGIEKDIPKSGLSGITLLRLDADMSITARKSLAFDQKEESNSHILIDICTWGGEITVLSYQLTQAENNLKLCYSVVDPVTLNLSRELIPIITYPNIPAQDPRLSRYIPPLEFNRSNNCTYFVGHVRFDSIGKEEAFIIGADKKILWQSTIDINHQVHISNTGMIAMDIAKSESTGLSYEHIVKIIDPSTNEIESYVLGNHNHPLPPSAISVGSDGNLIVANVIQKSNSAAELFFYIPGIHENPIITEINQEELELIHSSNRIKKISDNIGLKLFATYRKSDNSVIALFQRTVSDSRDEILAISIEPIDGSIEWIRKLRRKQIEYSPDRDLPISFYQDGILHLYYNKGTVHKSAIETQDPWIDFTSSKNGGAVYYLSISDEGVASETIAEKLHKGSYWRSVSISSNAPERTMLIQKQLLDKQKLGTISFDQ